MEPTESPLWSTGHYVRIQRVVKNQKLVIRRRFQLHWGRERGVNVSPGQLTPPVSGAAGTPGWWYQMTREAWKVGKKRRGPWHLSSLRWINERREFKILHQTSEEVEEKKKRLLVKPRWAGLLSKLETSHQIQSDRHDYPRSKRISTQIIKSTEKTRWGRFSANTTYKESTSARYTASTVT